MCEVRTYRTTRQRVALILTVEYMYVLNAFVYAWYFW